MKPLKIIIIAVIAALFIVSSFSLIEDVDSTEIVVIQYPTGKLNVYTTPGPKLQMFGSVQRYKKSNTFWFLLPQAEGEPDGSIAVKWQDGAQANSSQFIEMMGLKAMQDLSLSIKTK